MKLKEALLILIRSAKRDLDGTGTGIRSLPSEKESKKILAAIERVWLYVYGRKMDQNDRYNL